MKNCFVSDAMATGGGTPRAEALLEERRRVLRNALKSEFLRKKYNPSNYTADGGEYSNLINFKLFLLFNSVDLIV